MMAITEDDQIFSLLETAVQVGPNTIWPITAAGGVQRKDVNKLLGELGSNQLPFGAYVTHPSRYFNDVLSWGSDQIDQASLNVILETGSLLDRDF